MKILVINSGSSSLKYQILEMDTETLLAKGTVDRIGLDKSTLKHTKVNKRSQLLWVNETPIPTHADGMAMVLDAITDPEFGVVKDLSEIAAVGHRFVHGSKYTHSVIATDDVIQHLEENIDLAPLHMPPNLLCLKACKELMPDKPMVCVFDTAFHQTMPPEAYTYAIPYEYYEKYGIRKYGFHGTSHRYVSQRAAEILDKPLRSLKIVSCHLGNGASVAAIKNGKVIDTSMGFTPLEGLVMGTRSGDIDPAILGFLAKKEGMSFEDLDYMLNKQSGVYGISGVSSDFRDIDDSAANGNQRSLLALHVFAHRVKSYIGAYIAQMNGIDVLIFTAGIGENSAAMRRHICRGMNNLGIVIDLQDNTHGEEAIISLPDSPVTIMVIPTNEELMIARDTEKLVTM